MVGIQLVILHVQGKELSSHSVWTLTRQTHWGKFVLNVKGGEATTPCHCATQTLSQHPTADSSLGWKQSPFLSSKQLAVLAQKLPSLPIMLLVGTTYHLECKLQKPKRNCVCDLCHLIFMNGEEYSDTKITYLILAHPLCWPPSHTALGLFPHPSVGQSNFCCIHFLCKVHEVRVTDY